MQIAVTFRHMEADEALKERVQEKVGKLGKYIENPQEIRVVLSAEKFRHIAEITLSGDGGTFNSEGRDSDLYTAIDQMVEKMERQIRDSRERARSKRVAAAAAEGVLPETGAAEEREEEGVSIERRRVPVKPMSLDEAMAQLALSKQGLILFINPDTDQMNVLYNRSDGTCEWIEPSPK
jgi:putative sigma-54 modulation protein